MGARTYIVSRAEAGRTVADWLRMRLGLAPADVRHWLRERRVVLSGVPCADPFRRLQSGQRLEILSLPPVKTDASGAPTIRPHLVYADDHIVVVDKPPGVTTMRHAEDIAEFGRRAALLATHLGGSDAWLARQGEKGPAGAGAAVHRIDNETSGLVVFARTADAERNLGGQFRRTLRIVFIWRWFAAGRGTNASSRFWCADRGDGRRGSATAPQKDGQRAATHVRVVEALGEYSLVECRLETGRTHQVRIHLGEAGGAIMRRADL